MKNTAVCLSLLVCFSVVFCNAAMDKTNLHPKQGYKAASEPTVSPFMDQDVDQSVSEVPDGLNAEEWDEIRALMQKERYFPTRHEASDGFVASNPAHQWDVTFNEGEVLVRPALGDDWSWFLVPSGYGYKDSVLPLNDEPEVIVDENRIEYKYNDDLIGWYINDEKGLEHGFDIGAPPQPKMDGNLVIEMTLDTSLKPNVKNNGNDIVFLEKSGKEILNYGKLLITDATGYTIPSSLHLSRDSNTLIISIDDTNAVYPLIVDPLLIGEVAKLTTSDGAENDEFGWSVSICSDTVVIGAPKDDIDINDNQGSAYIFERNQGGADSWGEATKITASDGGFNDWFGYSVSISVDTIVVGAPYADGGGTDTGSAYVFGRNQGGKDNWGEIVKLISSDREEGDQLGFSVSIDGDTIVVGAWYDDVDGNHLQGSAYVFSRNKGGADNWGEVKKLMASDGAGGDRFGNSVSISVDTVVVGASSVDVGPNNFQGKAYIFERNRGGADNWSEVKMLIDSSGMMNDQFGYSVSISGDTIVVGVPWDDVGGIDSGSAFIFQRNQGGAGNWGMVTILAASDGARNDYFGTSVSISRDTVVVGAYLHEFGGNDNQGSAYVFERNLGGADNWGEVIMLRASDGEDGDWFGWTVFISDNMIVIGASNDDVGVNNAQGSASAFVRIGNVWLEEGHPVAFDGANNDWFGESVSISGYTVVIGAPADEIGAIAGQGSAYIFKRNQGGPDNWGLVVKLTASNGSAQDQFGKCVSISGDTIAVGAPYDDVGVNNDQGSVYVFNRNQGGADNWSEITNITAFDGAADDYFGSSVLISGDRIVVGAPCDDVGANDDQGSAYIFERNQGGADNWGEVAKLTASNGEFNDQFGSSVSISGDTIIVGALIDDVGANIDQGSAYIFERNQGGGDNWGEVANLTATDGAADDRFGVSVSISGDRVVVGSSWDNVGANGHQGSAYVFERNQGGADNWGEVTKLTATDGVSEDYFGSTVSICGDKIVVGVYLNNIGGNIDQGSAYVFERNQGGADNWGEVTNVTAYDGLGGDRFGISVSISGNTILVGSYYDDVGVGGNQGSAYIYYFHHKNTPPIITTADNKTADEDSEYSVVYEADDLLGDTLNWSLWTDADGWLTINSKTGLLSGTPDNSDVGSWNVNVTVSDINGSIDFRNFTLLVGNVAPAITIADNTTAEEDNLYSVDYASDDDGQGTVTWSISYTDTNSWLTINESTGVLSGTPDNSDVGSWIVNITVNDGNGGNAHSNFSLEVSNAVSVITTTDIKTTAEDALYSVDYSSGDDGQGTVTWSLWTNADSWLKINSSTGVLSGTPVNSDVGNWTVNVTVDDGNSGIDFRNFTLVVSNVAPNILTADETTIDEDNLYSVDYSSDEDGQGIITWNKTSNASWLSIDPGSGILSGTPANNDVGWYWVNVSVSDGKGGIDWTNFTLTVYNVNDAPIITTTDLTYVEEDNPYSVDYNANDPDVGDILIWNISYTNTDGWLTINQSTGVLSGTSDNVDVGIWTVNVTVSDGNGGTDYSNFTLVVINVAPIITTPDDSTAVEDSLYYVDYSSEDDGEGIITWSLDSNTTWLSIDLFLGILSGIPTNDDVGTYWVNVSVSDGNGGIGWTNFTLTVSNVNDAPNITTADDKTAIEDNPYSIDYEVNDPDVGDTLIWNISYTNNDGWLTINQSTGVLSGTPDNGDVGIWTVNVTVSDGNDSTDYSNFTLVVINVAPIIITAHNITAIEDLLYYVDYASEDDGQGNITWSLWTDADDWLTINASSGELLGTPDNSNVGNWTVLIVVSDNNGGVDFTQFTLTVLNTNDAPVIITNNLNLTMENATYLVAYNAMDDDLNALIWNLNTPVGWLSIDSSTGILSGTPSSTDIGFCWVNISVSDGNGGSDFTNFTLEVLTDTDADGIPNQDDNDDDGDSYPDDNDTFPLNPTEWLDTDGDTIGNNADFNDDNDDYPDLNDTFPLDPTEWEDFDSDGIGNNADDDDDNDGYKDEEDEYPLDPSKWEAPEGFPWWSLIVGIIISLFLLLLIIAFKRRKPEEEVPDKMLIDEPLTEELEKPIEGDEVTYTKENEKDTEEDEEVTFEEIEDEDHEPFNDEITFEEITEDGKEPSDDEEVTFEEIEDEGQKPFKDEITFEEIVEDGKEPSDDEKVTFEEIEDEGQELFKDEITFEENIKDKDKVNKEPESKSLSKRLTSTPNKMTFSPSTQQPYQPLSPHPQKVKVRLPPPTQEPSRPKPKVRLESQLPQSKQSTQHRPKRKPKKIKKVQNQK
jgi:hypothetical protein